MGHNRSRRIDWLISVVMLHRLFSISKTNGLVDYPLGQSVPSPSMACPQARKEARISFDHFGSLQCRVDRRADVAADEFIC